MSSGTYGEYGALIVCGDYKGKLNAIAKVLNRFEYDQGDERLRFVVHDGRIEPNNFGNETMSAFPLRVWLKSEDGRRIPGDEQCDHEDGGWEIDDYEEVSLEELSKTIAPLLTRGTLELVSIRHYRTRFILFHTLAIRSDGWAQRQSQEYESFQRRKWHTHSAATFEPPKLFPPHRSREDRARRQCGHFLLSPAENKTTNVRAPVDERLLKSALRTAKAIFIAQDNCFCNTRTDVIRTEFWAVLCLRLALPRQATKMAITYSADEAESHVADARG